MGQNIYSAIYLNNSGKETVTNYILLYISHEGILGEGGV